MPNLYRYRQSAPLIVMAVATLCLCSGEANADTPKRKPGLWEINSRMEGMPSMGPVQQCIDQNTDNLMQQRAQKGEKPDCSVMDSKTSGNRVTLHSVCKMEGTTVTTDGVFEGAFDSNYKGTMKSKFNPPMHGMAESTVTIDAKWLGPCKAGQKPGDVVLPSMGGKGMNMQQMMKDPKFQEMMRKQQQSAPSDE